MELSILEHCAKRDRERAAEKKADIAAAYPANPSEGAMKVEWDVKIERGRKSSTSKSGSKSLERDRLERERLALEMAEKVNFCIFEYFLSIKEFMKVEWDVKIERGRKSSTRKSGVKSSALMLERERLALEMAEKFSSNWFRNVQIGLELSKLVQKSSPST